MLFQDLLYVQSPHWLTCLVKNVQKWDDVLCTVWSRTLISQQKVWVIEFNLLWDEVQFDCGIFADPK